KRERLVELVSAVPREGNAVRVAPDRAVVMVSGDRVEGLPSRGEPPEAAARALCPAELGDPRGRALSGRDSAGTPREGAGFAEPLRYAAIVRHLLSPFSRGQSDAPKIDLSQGEQEHYGDPWQDAAPLHERARGTSQS